MMRKMKNKAGESLVEVIAALLVSALAMMMFAGAIVSTEDMNERARDEIAGVSGSGIVMVADPPVPTPTAEAGG